MESMNRNQMFIFFPVQNWLQLNETARTELESVCGISLPAGSSPVELFAKAC